MSLKFEGMEAHTVDKLEEIAEGVYLLSVIRKYPFNPGQVLALSTEENDPAPRIYSICSGKNDPFLKILFKAVRGGKLTPRLVKLKKGDQVFCSLPYGSFTDDRSPAFWIAAGTGIAPYISFAESGLTENKYLVHGGRTKESFYFSKELDSLLGERYVRCISTPCDDKNYYNGRLTSYLKEIKLPQQDFRYYLCGSAGMVVEARDILIARGVEYNNIMSEIYF